MNFSTPDMVSGTAGSEPAGHEVRPAPFHRVTLAFPEPELEHEFAVYFWKSSASLVRISLVLAAGLYLIFGVLDMRIVPEAAFTILMIRISVAAVLLLFLAASFHASFRRYFQASMGLVILLTGSGILAMIAISDAAGGYSYYAGLMLVVMFGHGMLRLRFVHATITTFVVLAAYEILVRTIVQTPDIIVTNNTFFLGASMLLGMFTSYGLEFHTRTVFWQRTILIEKQEALNAEHYRKTRELDAAREMQLSMLPRAVPKHPTMDLYVSMTTAAEVGGDYYDFLTHADGTVTFAVADAAGHGAQAGAMVAAMKVMFCNHAMEDEIDQFLGRASQHLRQMRIPKVFMTAMVGRIRGNRIDVAGAGLPPGLVYRHATRQLDHVDLKGIPLGTFVRSRYPVQSIELEPGDSVVFMTDGFAELFNRAGEMLGQEKVESLVAEAAHASARNIIRHLDNAAASWKAGQIQNDDITVLVIKRRQQVQPRPASKQPESTVQ